MAAAIRVRDNIDYRVGSTINLLCKQKYFFIKIEIFSNIFTDAASGSSPDHAVGHYHIPIAYTFEMRGNGHYGNHGFVLPAQFIIPNSLEVFDGFIAMVREARARGYL